MTNTEDLLRRTLQARADLVDLNRPAPGLPGASDPSPWRQRVVWMAAAAAVVGIVGTAAVVATRDDGSPSPQPAGDPTTGTPSPVPTGPTPPTSGVSTDPGTARGDVDGDGTEDTVTLTGRNLAVSLGDGRELGTSVPRGSELAGLADVGMPGMSVVLTDGVTYQVSGSDLIDVTVGDYPLSVTWVDGNRLLGGVEHELDGTTYVTAYAWTWDGMQLTPTVDQMYCRDTPGSGVPQLCGSADTFLGDTTALGTEVVSLNTIGVGEGRGALSFGDGSDTVRLEGSTESEVGDGDVELVWGSGARYPLPAGGAPLLVDEAYQVGADWVFAVSRSLGDSYEYQLYRFDGANVTPVEVAPVDGLTLVGGGPAGGGPNVDVFTTVDGRFLTAEAAQGLDVYQKAVLWQWEGSDLVGREVGPVCLDTLTASWERPHAVGTCDLG